MKSNIFKMLKIDNSELKKLEIKAANSENGLSRICLHNSGSYKVQLMIIAAIPGKIYPPISDCINGWITYTVLRGSLIIRTYDEKKTNLMNSYDFRATKMKLSDFSEFSKQVYLVDQH